MPAENYNGEVGKLTVRAADDTYTGDLTGGTIDLTGKTGTTHPWSDDSGTVTITVNPVNDAPELTATETPTVTENDDVSGDTGVSIEAPLFNAGSVVVTDPDLGTGDVATGVFGAGTITVSLGANKIPGDSLEIATGLAGVESFNVDGDGKLTITLTEGATKAQVEKIIESIKFVHKGDDPTNIVGAGDERSSVDFTVVLNDGNNVQSAGDAGGPDGLEATLSGTIVLEAKNDPPVANNDTNGLKNSDEVPVSGNVITGVHKDVDDVETTNGTDTDPDTKLEDLKITGIQKGTSGAVTEVTGATTIEGEYGTLTINPDGSYSYQLDKDNPDVYGLAKDTTLSENFTYTLSDGDETDTANLVITITGDTPPALGITVTDHNGATDGQATVHESGLSTGSEPRSGKHIVEDGKINVQSPSGLKDLKVGDKTFTAEQIKNASPSDPITVTTPLGKLIITGAITTGDPDAPTSVELTYSYELTGRTDNSNDPNKDGITDPIALEVTDNTNQTETGTLEIYIIDDQPEAKPDAAEVNNQTNKASGNALSNDILGADRDVTVTDIVGPKGELGVNDAGVITVAGEHGSLVIQPDGEFTYTRDGDEPLSEPEVFTYTITDADGDKSTSTITITNQAPPVVVPVPDDYVPNPVPPTNTTTGTDRPNFLTPPDAQTNRFSDPRSLWSDQVKDPSVFFEGATFTKIQRMQLPFHPIVYVNNEVRSSQLARTLDDIRHRSDVGLVMTPEVQSKSIGAGLGQDKNVFVMNAVRQAHSVAQTMGLIVDGRLGRVGLSADGLLYSDKLTPSSSATAPGTVDAAEPEVNEDQPMAADVTGRVAPSAQANTVEADSLLVANSFSQQLQLQRTQSAPPLFSVTR